jgi:hypothetical protein
MGEFMLRKLVDAKARPNRETAQTRAEECLSASKKVLRRRTAPAVQQQRFGPLPRSARVCLIRRTRSRRDNALAPTPLIWRNSAIRRAPALSSVRAMRRIPAQSGTTWRPHSRTAGPRGWPACGFIARAILIPIAPCAKRPRAKHTHDHIADTIVSRLLLAASVVGCYQDRS